MTTTSSLPQTQAFILAGGQGERLFPLTVSRPKPAIPFGGVSRIIDFTVSNCLSSNISASVRIGAGAHVEDSVLMSGVHVGQGVRLRHAIVEEGVRIPDGFSAGLDHELDRMQYSISRNGVVVISETPKLPRPVLRYFHASDQSHAARTA